jgi:hypothetical protein
VAGQWLVRAVELDLKLPEAAAGWLAVEQAAAQTVRLQGAVLLAL